MDCGTMHLLYRFQQINIVSPSNLSCQNIFSLWIIYLKKKKKGRFFKKKIQIGISTSKFLSWEKKFSCQPQKCKLELYMSNGFQVLIYLSFLLLLKEVALKRTKQLLWCYCSVNNNLIKIFFTIFKITND